VVHITALSTGRFCRMGCYDEKGFCTLYDMCLTRRPVLNYLLTQHTYWRSHNWKCQLLSSFL